MRDDAFFLLPALLIATYQISLWKRLKGNNIAIVNGKYTLVHFLAFIFAKYSTYSIFTYQLFFDLFKITDTHILFFYIVGYTFIIVGFLISISAIHRLGKNWDNMMLYKIAPNHKLITHGIYKYIRHPIYLAIILEVVGYQIIANSWLLIFYLFSSTIILVRHIKNEEDLLTKYFGNEYLIYMKHTKKIIPFIY